MKPAAAEHLVSAHCGNPLVLTVREEREGEVIEGTLAATDCSAGCRYPVCRGVPRLLTVEARTPEELQTRESFSRKWRRAPEYRATTSGFYVPWFLGRYGFESLAGLRRFLEPARFVLDAGTGTGRDALMYAKHSAAQVFAVDISDGIEVAYEDLFGVPNLHLIQADLRDLPFPRGFFDVVACDQVLHHTLDVRDSLARLLRHLRVGGYVLFYVYRRKGPIREFSDDFIRERTTRMSDEECYRFSEVITLLGKTLADLKARIVIPEAIPVLEIPAGEYDLQRLFHWHVMKCFWNNGFDWESNVIVNYDWYRPRYAHRHTEAEVRSWCRELRLRPVRVDIRESGISVVAAKEA